jgi:RNase P/RNase MRP subunit p29
MKIEIHFKYFLGYSSFMEFQYRRQPAIPRNISDINPEKDVRVRLLGRIAEKSESTFIIEDESGRAEVVADDMKLEFNKDDTVRVFARVLPLEEGFELRAEIIQNMNELDMDLYKKILP